MIFPRVASKPQMFAYSTSQTNFRSPESSDFCATHMRASSSKEKGKRVPCPVDPSHTVFEKLLASHLKVRGTVAMHCSNIRHHDTSPFQLCFHASTDGLAIRVQHPTVADTSQDRSRS